MRLIESPRNPDSPAIQIDVVADRFYPADYAWLRLFGDTAPASDTPEISIRRCSDGHYLRQAGWAELPGTVPALDQVAQDGVIDLLLGAEPFARVAPGTAVEIAVPAFELRQTVTWPTLFDGAPVSPGAEDDGSDFDDGDDIGDDGGRDGAEAAVDLAPAAEAAHGNQAAESVLDSPAADVPLQAGHRARPAGVRTMGKAERKRPRRERRRSWRAATVSAREADLDAPGRTGGEEAHGAGPAREHRRPGGRRVPLPWKITAINLVLIVGIAFLGVQMSTGGIDPFALFSAGDERAVPGAGAPRAATDLDAYERAALDSLAGTVTAEASGDDPLTPLRQEADALVRGDAAAADLTGAARRFAEAGRPAVALALYELAWSRGGGDAALAIGRMSDPRFFTAASSGFTRPNAELAITWYRRALDAGTMAAVIELDDLRLALEEAAARGDQEAANALLLFE